MTGNLAAEQVRQAEARVEAVRAELSELTRRQADVAALVEERRAEQREAALEMEGAGGRDGRELTRRVAALQEAEARAGALAELAAAKVAELAATEPHLDAARRALAADQQAAAVAALVNECRTAAATVQELFEQLALAAGTLELLISDLDRLDRAAAQSVAATVTPSRLRSALLAKGAVAIGDDQAPHGLSVPVVVLAPALAAAGRQVATVAELRAVPEV